MKNFILSLGLIISVNLMLVAQDTTQENTVKNNQVKKEKTPEQRANIITKRMMKVTAASADKEPKINEINLATEKQRETDRALNANNKEGLKASRKKRNLERESKLKEVFSAEEYTKWDAHKKEMKAKQKAKQREERKAKLNGDEEIQEIITD